MTEIAKNQYPKMIFKSATKILWKNSIFTAFSRSKGDVLMLLFFQKHYFPFTFFVFNFMQTQKEKYIIFLQLHIYKFTIARCY